MDKINIITPIILLGSGRNGTTMLSNIVAEYPEVAAIQHELHWGIHESNIYENCKYWGEFKTIDDYINFLEVYTSMDTFTISGLNKEDFYTERHPKNFMEFYFEMMDKYTKANSKKYWLTKIDPLYYLNDKELNYFLEKLYSRYTNVKFISIKRNIVDVVLSYLDMEGRYKNNRRTYIGRMIGVFLGVSRYIVHYDGTEKVLNENNGCEFEYEHFIEHSQKDRKKLVTYLSLTQKINIIELKKFQKNSSFSRNDKQQTQLFLKLTIRILYNTLKHMVFLPKFSLNLYEKVKSKKRPDYWRLKKEKKFLKGYINELTQTSEIKLIELLKRRNGL